MVDKNNMYIQGKPIERKWLNPVNKITGKLADIFHANRHPLPQPGQIKLLPSKYRDFQPSYSLKNFKTIDYTHLAIAEGEKIQQAIEWVTQKVGWFHSIDLPDEIQTPGSRGWEIRRDAFSVPERVKGKTVLDLGTMEGGDSFCAEESGAIVTAYDVDNYFEYDLGKNAAWDFVVEKYHEAKESGEEAEWIFLNSKKFGFELCKQARRSKVNRVSGSIYDLNPKQHGTFDIVYCFGLLYHLRHPILALDKVYNVTKEMAFINDQTFTGHVTDPNIILFFNDTWRGSYTNWFVPTPSAFLDLLSNIGWRKIEVVDVSKTSISVICYK